MNESDNLKDYKSAQRIEPSEMVNGLPDRRTNRFGSGYMNSNSVLTPEELNQLLKN